MRGDLSQSFLCIVDADQGIFSVEDPMKDDQLWSDAVFEAQDSGRAVRCFSVPRWGNQKAVERSCAALYSFEVKEPGSIITPSLHCDQTDTLIIVLPAKRKLNSLRLTHSAIKVADTAVT